VTPVFPIPLSKKIDLLCTIGPKKRNRDKDVSSRVVRCEPRWDWEWRSRECVLQLLCWPLWWRRVNADYTIREEEEKEEAELEEAEAWETISSRCSVGNGLYEELAVGDIHVFSMQTSTVTSDEILQTYLIADPKHLCVILFVRVKLCLYILICFNTSQSHAS